MDSNDNQGAFDRLVANLSSEDRTDMLNKLKKTAAPSLQLVETDRYYEEQPVSLKLKYKEESIFYRFFLWLRSLFQKRPSESIYNDDLISNIAKQISRDHPGVLNHRSKVLDTVFYDRLIAMKDAADFFKNFFVRIDEATGDFYVFLSSFVAPELTEKINSKVDPFTLSFDTEPTNEVRNNLLKNLDDCLKNINLDSKNRMYSAVCSVNWLEHFSKLPFIHFSAQFTNLVGSNYTCPYKNARLDFDSFASVFSDIHQVASEILEALMLFSNKKGYSNKSEQIDIERALKEFLAKANDHLASIQMFISCVPVVRLGKVINDDYDWAPEQIEGVEAWFKSFRSSWRKIIDTKWNEWIRERKKNMLSIDLKEDFGLSSFPVMKNRPWLKLWTRVPFTCELTGGYLAWFHDEFFNDMLNVLNVVIMEGVFTSSENRNVFSEGLNSFVQAMNETADLQEALAPNGEFGAFFEENVSNKIRSFKVQEKIDSMISKIEVAIHDSTTKFLSGCKMMEKIFDNLFDAGSAMHQEVLQNFMLIKGHKNREWRDELLGVRTNLKKGVFYISELAPIESGKNV